MVLCMVVMTHLRHAAAVEPLLLHAVSAKRKRQEDFQSRKRQAVDLTPATVPGPSATKATSSGATASLPAMTAGQTTLATDNPEPTVMDASPTADLPLTGQISAKQLGAGAADTGPANIPGNKSPAAASSLDTNTATSDHAGMPSQSPLLEEHGDANGAIQPDSSPLQAHSKQQSGFNQVESTKAIDRMNGAAPTSQRYVVAKPVNEARGHTGYLTFARRSVDD